MRTGQKKIVLLTYGSRGDVEPFLALASGIIAAGYLARVVGPAPFASLAEEYHIPYTSILGDPAELARFFAETAGKNYPKMVHGIISHVIPLAKNAFAVIRESVQDCSLIIHSFLMLDAGHTFAKIQDIPDVSAQMFPIFLPTRDFASIGFPRSFFGGGYNIFTHRVNNLVFSQGARILFRILKSKNPDWPNIAPWPFRNTCKSALPVLFGFSPILVPKPSDWPINAHITGYWKLPPALSWKPKGDLLEFLNKGQPPIFYSPGSMQSGESRRIATDIISVARKNNYRIILSLDKDSIPPALQGDDVYFASELPHFWLFPKMGLIMHHGGAGTTGAAITAGVPSVAVPFSADQFFWADRLDRLQVGPHSIPAKKVSQDTLNFAFSQLKSRGKDYSRQAHQLSNLVNKEQGVETSLGIILKILEGEENQFNAKSQL